MPRDQAEVAALSPRSMTVLLDVTNKCNLRCRFCYFSYDSVAARTAVHMAPATFARIAAELFPLAHTVYLSAGCESLVHPHFPELLEIASRHAPPLSKLLTNGLLLTPAVIDGMIEFGLRELHVSMEGATRATYEHMRRGASFEHVLRNLRALDARKRATGSRTPLLQLNVALMRSNLDELELFVDLAREHGAERIACRHLMPYKGLGMESEASSDDPARANERYHAFLERATRAGIDVTSFPDFYAVDGSAWLPPAAAPNERSLRRRAHPLGSFDAPAAKVSCARRSLQLGGWALAPAGAAAVEIRRSRAPDEARADVGRDGLVLIGRARFANATRPDVARAHRELPLSYRAGWTFELAVDDLPPALRGGVEIHAVAIDGRGGRTRLGQRWIAFGTSAELRPHLYCRKPFDNVYVDSAGNVYPYPDCQAVDPFGSLLGDSSFRSIWLGPAFGELRRRIEQRDPPDMCRTCPDFINRNVDDARFFGERDVEPALRRPHGALDQPGPHCTSASDAVWLHGWALGYSPVVRIEIVRDAAPTDPAETRRDDGGVLVGCAEPATSERPDVAAAYPRLPGRERAGWSFELKRADLPGDEPVRIRAVARNADGRDHVLGATTVRFAGLTA